LAQNECHGDQTVVLVKGSGFRRVAPPQPVLEVGVVPTEFLGVAAGFSFCAHVDNFSCTGRYQQQETGTWAQGLVEVVRELLQSFR
jgi:hypothetical protein